MLDPWPKAAFSGQSYKEYHDCKFRLESHTDLIIVNNTTLGSQFTIVRLATVKATSATIAKISPEQDKAACEHHCAEARQPCTSPNWSPKFLELYRDIRRSWDCGKPRQRHQSGPPKAPSGRCECSRAGFLKQLLGLAVTFSDPCSVVDLMAITVNILSAYINQEDESGLTTTAVSRLNAAHGAIQSKVSFINRH